MKIERAWAMPNKWTFKIKPIEALLNRYVKDLGVGWANPFCGHSLLGDKRNDLDPKNTFAQSHLMAYEFLASLPDKSCEGVLFDPPYSPRQVSECYKSIGKSVGMKDTQNQWTLEKDQISRVVKPGGYVLSFGWNTNGIGKKRGFEVVEVLIVAHGSAHNDTLCTVEINKLLGGGENE